MRLPESRAEMTTKRLLLVGSFLLVSVVTTAAFAQAVTGHLAAMHAPSADVTVVGHEVVDDRLDVTVRVHNPTVKNLELGTVLVNVYVGGEQVTDGTTSRTRDDVTVPPHETERVTFPLRLREGMADRFRDADPAEVEMRGRIDAYVVEEMVYLSVEETGVSG
ncbi:LEA type 2 family protein [Halorussus salinisoli]|uniref:LEA type 2 family protein n=1 Tax=Halorussus salinisoli TaxID=2558242 RepID=UPI0010C23238|nr:LEA type 2 family protein [Halorussus salinisoli]